ncbi:DUF916 domain-containing protein [Levilactobacillus acidifarinae]|uniref:DUF916 domain-containing protein n=1 Tax=Levilactobacillus acidifarinae TaxID=267364 RepID=UPI000A95D101|nr:DUF916 domain-containing protein [Levilactobacillus acidifarinae]GEO68353.1 cell surface protein [Levilactobacillus acidifarinae]
MLLKKWRPYLLMLSLMGALGVGLLPNTTVRAATGPTTNGAFTVSPVLPQDNRQSASYFDFASHPGQHRTLQLKVTNQSAHAQVYHVTPRLASTNTNGYLDYGHDNHNPALPAQTTALFQPSRGQTVQVSPGQTQTVHFTFKAPTKAFAGILLGGFTVGQRERPTTHLKGTGIVAATEYVVALRTYNHQPRRLNRSQVTFQTAQYRLIHAQPQIVMRVANRTPALVSQGKLAARVVNDAGKAVAKVNLSSLLFAPQDTFNLNLDLATHQLPAGRYTLAGHLATRGGFDYPISLPVTVTKQQANSVSRHAVVAPSKPTNWWLVTTMVLAGMLIGVGGLEFYRFRRHLASRK